MRFTGIAIMTMSTMKRSYIIILVLVLAFTSLSSCGGEQKQFVDDAYYLKSTGDTSDRTKDIQTMLNNSGVCKLGGGVFYVRGIDIPNLGMLSGCGGATTLVLDSSVTEGYAVKLGSLAVVKDLRIVGSVSEIKPSQSIGSRHGILF